MLTKEELSKLYELYSKMNDVQQADFYKHFGLAYISLLDPLHKVECEHEDFYEYKFDYTRIFSNHHTKDFFDKYAKKIQHQLKRENLYAVIQLDDIAKFRYCPDNNIYTVLDSTDFNGLLVLAKKVSKERSIRLYKERVKKNFDASDTYNVDRTIAISILPNVLEHFQTIVKSCPTDVDNVEEWKSILTKIIWFLNETINSTDRDKIDFISGRAKLKQYNEYMQEAKQLFVDYFDCLWY